MSLLLRQAARLLSIALALGPALSVTGLGLLLCPQVLQAQEAEPIVLSISPQALARDYNGQPAAIVPATDLAISPGSDADYTFKITYAGKTTPPRNAGSYPVKVVATSTTNPARTATATATLVIIKAPLLVYANDQVRLFGSANPALTLSYQGFVNGETVSVLNRRPVATTTAKTSSPDGEYAITVSGGTDNNYELYGYNAGRLLVLPAFPGTYECFLYELGDTVRPVGKLSLTLPARGAAFTGRLDLAAQGAALPLSGTLVPEPDITGASGSAARKTSAGDIYRVAFTVSDEGLVPEIFLREKGSNDDISVFTAATTTRLHDFTGSTPTLAGAYTFALINPTSENFLALSPVGLGFASATISADGALKLSGRFSDGTTLSASARPDSDKRYRLFLRPYGSRKDSYAAGEFVLEPHPDADRVDRFYVPDTALRSLYWTKAKAPGTPDKLFPEGFGPVDSRIVLDPWLPPAKAKPRTSTSEPVAAITLAQRLGLVTDPAASGYAAISYDAEVFGSGSSGELPLSLEFTPANAARPLLQNPPANPRSWKITSLSTSNGRFTGAFKLTDTDYLTGKTYPRSVTFQGILRQPPLGDSTLAAGYFILKDLPTAFEPVTRSLELRLLRD